MAYPQIGELGLKKKKQRFFNSATPNYPKITTIDPGANLLTACVIFIVPNKKGHKQFKKFFSIPLPF